MSFTTSKFWTAALERAVKTFAQALITLWGTDTVGLLDIDVVQALSVGGGAAVLSILTSVASDAVTQSDGPSLVNEIAVGKHAR